MPETVYHYTTRRRARAIERSGYIRSSRNNVAFGPGVYATKMNPTEFSREDIARNNYDGSSDIHFLRALAQGKINCAIRLRVPKGYFQPVSHKRNIWLYSDKWYLDDCKSWEVIDIYDD